MANEIIDTLLKAIKDSGVNADALSKSLKEIIGDQSFKDFILSRKNIDILRYEEPISLDDNTPIIYLVLEKNVFYAIRNKLNFKKVGNSISYSNLYIHLRESTGLNIYAGKLPSYYLDYLSIPPSAFFNPSITFQSIKEKL